MPQCPATDYLDQFRKPRPSKRCIEFIQSFEQCRLKAYLPTPDDVWTVGWGSTGPDVKRGTVWTQEQADARFAADLERFAEAVRKAIGDTPTRQCEFDAMCSLAYNIGADAFARSTLVRKHVDGDKKGAAAQFERWVFQKGKKLAGLVRRRVAERAMYEGE